MLAQLQPCTEDKVSVTEDEIVFKKKTYNRLTLKELRKRVKEAGSDRNQLRLEEISQIVKEVRQELWTDK